MNLDDLTTILDDNDLILSQNPKQVEMFYGYYLRDFIDNPFVVKGKKMKLITVQSNLPGLQEYHETFAHIVTRKYKGHRIYMADRANRIHWIKPILLSEPCNEIKYYKWKDNEGVCKEHFWLIHRDFMVVLKDIGNDTQIVTAFCVDDSEKLRYYERYKDYENGRSECK